MRVIGTAGHVDHGKSTLIAALTGTHPDRLIEEQKRQMTIELGFGWLTLPNGEDIGIIDVPGHRDFIGNMLAGVGAIDAVILVISADEGVMPQTKEHLAILDLLQVRRGIVVLSKIDLVNDPEWLDLIEMDIRNTLSKTSLEDAPILRISSQSKLGLRDLLISLEDIIKTCPERVNLSRPRLPIDRVFSIAGFGTIVTGTLLDGSFFTGEEIEILPGHIFGRIRGLQNHKNKETQAQPGSRTAINISGISKEEIQRGNVLALRGQYKTSRSLVVNIKLLKNISIPIKHGTEIKLFLGTSEVMAKIRLLGTDKLDSGENGWLQLDLREPMVSMRGDRFIIRRPSPSETLGGGIVVESHPKQRYRRFSKNLIERLEAILKGTPEDIFYQGLITSGPGPIKEIFSISGLSKMDALTARNGLIESGLIISLDSEKHSDWMDEIIIAVDQLRRIKVQIEQIIDQFHKDHPLKPGLSKEELKSRLKISSETYIPIIKILANDLLLIDKGSIISRPDFKIQYTQEMDIKRKELLDIISKDPLSPPSVKECKKLVSEDVFSAMIELGELIQVSPEVVFQEKDYGYLVSAVKANLDEKGQITIAEARDLFNTSRKYILALFEYMDSKGITIRDNDFRRLRR